MGKYRSAIVGCGRIASLFSKDNLRGGVVTHAAMYKDNPETELVAACDIDKKKLEEFGSTWEMKALYTDFEEMLKNENIDIVSICTWDTTHYELVMLAAKYGVKAIFCEKPIADNLSKADEMVALCKEKGIVFAVNHSRRWDNFEHKIKDYIVSGKLGEIQCVSAYYTAGIANTGTHLLDLLGFFFDEVKWVWANSDGVIEGADPTLDGCMFFNKGFSCFLHGMDVNAYVIFEIDIYGKKGRLRIKNSGFNLQAWEVIDSPRFSGYKELKETSPFVQGGYKDVLKNALKDIVKCIETKTMPFSSGGDGLKTLELICALHASLEKNGKKVFLPLENRDATIKSK